MAKTEKGYGNGIFVLSKVFELYCDEFVSKFFSKV